MPGDPQFAPPKTVPPEAGDGGPIDFGAAGAVPPTMTAYDPLPAAAPPAFTAPMAPAIAPPPYASPTAATAPKSKVPLLVGILAISVAVFGAIGFIVYRRQAATATDDTSTPIEIPKKTKVKATGEPEKTATPAAPTPTAAPVEPTPTATATPPPKPTATTPPKPTATTPPKPTATTPPTSSTPPRPRIPRIPR
jgi:hypothetical protein